LDWPQVEFFSSTQKDELELQIDTSSSATSIDSKQREFLSPLPPPKTGRSSQVAIFVVVVASSSSSIDRRKCHVAAGPSQRPLR
jgi:hypothetical protein